MPTMTPRPTSRLPILGKKRAGYERKTRYAGQPVMVNPAPYQAHVLTLVGMGMPVTAIAREAGVSDGFVYDVRDGKYPTVRIRPALAIAAVTHHPKPVHVNVIAIGAVRRLQALRAIGWTWANLADHTGLPGPTVQLLHRRTVTSWQAWKAIHDTYEALSGTPGGAARKRPPHPAPLDWEGHDIDDPRVTVEVAPWRPKTARELVAERRVLVGELTGKGLSASEIADRLGVTQRTVVRDRGDLAVTAA